VVAHAYGLSLEHVTWLLKDCFHPCELYSNRETRRQLDPKGFWRVDEDLPSPIRHTTLFLSAFKALLDLVEKGIPIAAAVESLTGTLPGEGWVMPEDAMAHFQRLGHDLSEPFPEQSPDESWCELEQHRRNLFDTPLWTGLLSSSAQNEEETIEFV
jgi:hypothetical protein